MFLPIDNVLRGYAWGRRGDISRLLGRPRTDAIEAEWWLGAHPGSPSRVLAPARVGGAADLADAVATTPDLTAGVGRIPFLLKLITPGAPLSLQAHPNADQAAHGFAREEDAGIPRDAHERVYRDPFPKPELLVALEDRFQALAGLRPVGDSVATLRRMRARCSEIGVDARVLGTLTDRLGGVDGSAVDLGGQIGRQLRRDGTVADEIEAVSRVARAHPGEFPVQNLLAHSYPGDPGIVISVLLHHLVLRRGEAVYLPAGNLHAYLDGVGIELMTASDNVLRGGLTSKHIDVPGLLGVLDPVPGPAPRLVTRDLPGGGREYRPPDADAGFGLAWIESTATLPLAGAAVVLCLEGEFAVRGERSSTRVTRGEAMVVSPDETVLAVDGGGLAVVAR